MSIQSRVMPQSTMAALDHEDMESSSHEDMDSSTMQVDRIMFTSLCAAFSNWSPIVSPVVRRHSNRWRLALFVIIVIMTFSASFAHLRSILWGQHEERSAMRSLRVSLQTTQLQASKEESPPRVLLMATVTSWTLWGVLLATRSDKRRMLEERAILAGVLFLVACMLTHWTRIRYGEMVAQDVKE